MNRFRNEQLPRDIAAPEPGTRIEIEAVGAETEVDHDDDPVVCFRVTFVGEKEKCLPGSVDVSAQLASRSFDATQKRWESEVTRYTNRWEDLYPGKHGYNTQLRRSEVYRYELTPAPSASWDYRQPGFDFSRFERFEITVRARAADGTMTENVFVRRRARRPAPAM